MILKDRHVQSLYRILRPERRLRGKSVPAVVQIHSEFSTVLRTKGRAADPGDLKSILYHIKKLPGCIVIFICHDPVVIIDIQLIRREDYRQEIVVLFLAGKARICSPFPQAGLHCRGGSVVSVRDVKVRNICK